MSARTVAALLLVLLLLLHVQLWTGRGDVAQVRAWQAELQELQDSNAAARLRNDQLASEVRDLTEGLGMVEELARHDLGMVRPNEIFVDIRRD